MDVPEIINRMRAKGLSLATAESCTGGRISAAITAISGASDVFQGAVVAYQSRVKTELLGVPEEVITKYDVVSEQVSSRMVRGACKCLSADIAIASTGYAGPSSANPNIPVGTIWIACGTENEVLTKRLSLQGDRIQNVEKAVEEALGLLEEFINHTI